MSYRLSDRLSYRLNYWLPIFAFVLIGFPALFSQNSHGAAATPSVTNPCAATLIEKLNSEILGLQSINDHFNNLSQGKLSQSFSLASIFTINLLDERDVSRRILELQQMETASYLANASCQEKSFLAALKKRRELLEQISQLRSSYLGLTLEERRYLNSLINLFKRTEAQQVGLEGERQSHQQTTDDLSAQLASLEQAFKTQLDPQIRAELSDKMTEVDNQRQAINARQNNIEIQHANNQVLLTFTSALLIDHWQFYIAQNYTAGKAFNIFRDLLAWNKARDLRFFLNPDRAKKLGYDKTYIEDFASLIIISSRIYSKQRRHTSITHLFSENSFGFGEHLDFELKTLIALPFANIYLKLHSDNPETGYLSRSLSQSAANLVTQLIGILAFWVFLKRIPGWVNSSQRFLVKNYLSWRSARPLIGLMRLLQPNAAWLFAVGFYSYLDSLNDADFRDVVILYDFTAIIAFYLFVNTLASWAISNTNAQAHLFVLRSKQQAIAHHCKRFGIFVTLISILYIVLISILSGGIFCSLYKLAIVVFIWIFSYRLINQFHAEFNTHLSKRISSDWLGRFEKLQESAFKSIANPAIFVLLQLMDLTMALHNRLMRLESYQSATAKFLKIRLEQSQQISSETQEKEPQQDDTHYENWFLNRALIEAKPNLLIQNNHITEINKFTTEWLKDVQEENDLALIGESGVGKSTLIKQWLQQWESCKTIYLSIPEKTITETAIFKLILDALEFESCNDIAEFVVKQQSIEKTIIVIDEAQHLFLSEVGCFDGYKMLQSLLGAKLENIFWLVAINQPSWVYLNDVFGRTYQFSNRINIQRWSLQEIRDLILNRHKASRRQLTYDELLLASTSNVETATRAAESRCFSLLWDQSAGLPAVALSIWINSASNPAKGKIEMGVPERPTSNTLLNLSDDYLFVYSALVTHESLNTQQAQAVTHLPEAIVRRALKLGLDQGFLQRKSHGRYIINPLWYLQLCQLLRRKNFLHE
ncbi:MAG: AAA family ATPase [Pseudomonadales bacterium]|nr:AAA family ATPase [Pseudomonadales bacterium]